MYGRESGQFAQFFDEVEEIVQTPSRKTSRVVNTPTGRLSTSDLEKTTSTMTPRMEIMLKKEKKAREDAANLTFRPHVNKANGHAMNNVSSSGPDNRFDALYSDALKRHLECKWKENAAEDKDLTFTPKITERGRSRASSRAGSRAGSRASSREREAAGPESTTTGERLHSTPKGKLKHGVDPDNQLTFKPEITKRAMSIDRKESAKRLYTPNSIEKEKAKDQQRYTEAQQRELEDCTFSPKLNQPNKFSPKTKVDIRERMSKFEEMKNKKLQDAKRLKAEQELADATFHPVMMSKSTKIAAAAASASGTPAKPFHERLAHPFERHVPDEVVAELNASMTFKPTLATKRSASVSSGIISILMWNLYLRMLHFL